MGDVTVEHVRASVSGRLLVRPSAGSVPAPLLVGFHGYGENARDHLEALEGIPGVEDWNLAAIQALHPFYRGRTGEVVATWMTRLDREMAIADNVRYVGSAVDRACEVLAAEGATVAIGFSQGASMAYRAVAGSGRRFDGLVALAGDVPADVVEAAPEGFPPVLIGRGSEDEWYTAEKMSADLESLALLGVVAETRVFAGGHEWGRD